MRPILLHPNPPETDVVKVLDLSARDWFAVDSGTELAAHTDAEGLNCSVAVVSVGEDPKPALALCSTLREVAENVTILMLVSGRQVDDLSGHELFDDFCLTPFHPREFELRLEHLLWRAGHNTNAAELVVYEELVLNVETYEAAIAGKPLDLTYMEYELLRYLAAHPGRVFTREILLSQVWGYDYFGGARTVDVHIRRLRSKLGEEHSPLIQTVRSVGYSLGKSRWQG